MQPIQKTKIINEIVCTESCPSDSSSASIRCHLCFTWYHTNRVGIKDLDTVDTWVCADCKALPKTGKVLMAQVETLNPTTSNIFKTFETFSKNKDKKFDYLKDSFI